MRTMMVMIVVLGASTSMAMDVLPDAPASSSCLGYIFRRAIAWWRQRTLEERNHELLTTTSHQVENLEKVQDLVTAGASVSETDDDEATPLHNAAYQDHAQIAEFLIRQGAPVDALNKAGWTALHIAADQSHLKTVKVLLSYDARIDVQSKDGRTPLHCAAQKGCLNIVLCLLCQSFFTPGWRIKRVNNILNTTRRSERDRVKALLEAIKKTHYAAKNAERIAEKAALQALARMMEPWSARIIAGLVMVEHQQEMIKTWEEDNSSKALQRKKLLVDTHCSRHFERVKQVLAMKDKEGKTAGDRATIEDQPHVNLINVPQLLKDIKQAKTIDNLSGSIKQSIIKNIHQRLAVS